MLVELANRTVADGHRVSVIVTRTGVVLAPQLDPRIRLLVLGRQRRFEIGAFVRLARWLRASKVDVLHCHGRSSFSLVALLKAVGATTLPVVLHDHLGVQLHPNVPRWFSFARGYLSAYVAVDVEQLGWADRAGIPRSRTHVLGNGLDLTALRAQHVTGAPLPACEGPRLVFVGGLRREKAIDVLFLALDRLVAPVTLFIIGADVHPAYGAECRVEAARFGDRVQFLGQRLDALPLAATADLAVHPARSESGPLVLAEYAALGLPFVSTLVGAIARELADTGIGRFVPPDDAGALAAAIDETLAQPRSMAASWSERAFAMFDLAAMMPRWYDLYAELVR